jgi:F-type H+-transporting ATPase subunit delta
MKLTSQQYAEALYDAISETAPHDHDKVLDNFVKVLAQNGDLGKYEEIEAEFRKLKLESQGIKEVEITIAREAEMNRVILDELNAVVRSHVGDGLKPSPTTEIKTRVDESIIGGVVVRVDDTLIDAGVKNQLNNLNQALKS